MLSYKEVIKDFEGMDAGAFWHDVQFSLRHVQDFSRIAIVTNPDVHHLWSSLVAPSMRCDVEHFSPGEMEAQRDWLMWPEVGRGLATRPYCPVGFGAGFS